MLTLHLKLLLSPQKAIQNIALIIINPRRKNSTGNVENQSGTPSFLCHLCLLEPGIYTA